MKLVTLRIDHSFRTGIVRGADVIDLAVARTVIPALASLPTTMRGLLASLNTSRAAIDDAVAALEGRERPLLMEKGGLFPFVDATLGVVVPDPDLVLAGSMNSRGHLAEMGDELPEHPCAFLKVRSALAAGGQDIEPPPGYAEMLDWEGEFCVVIGSRCHRVAEADALDYVAGYTLMNDLSARDFVLPFVKSQGPSPSAQAWERNVLGKNFPTFCPIGPVIATPDEFPDSFDYRMETLVNGEVMQSSSQEDLVFDIAQMISYFSTFYVLQPGDIISMGSPPGVGMARKPPRFLKPGDVVEVKVAEIGTLRNRIANLSS